jgi:hypothetical protein
MRRALFVSVVAAAAALGAACGDSEYSYVASSKEKTYLRVPHSWRVFDEDELIASEDGASREQVEAARARQWLAAFDASPRPSLQHIDRPAEYPSGLVQVRALTAQERDVMSNQVLRSQLLDADPLKLQEEDPARLQVLTAEDVTRKGGFRGTHLVVSFRAEENRPVTTMNYSALVDSKTRYLYMLLIHCRTDCYERNRSVIDDIVESWTVEER